MQQLTGRTAILTGASGGIGRHIARALAGEGMHLALTARSTAALEELAAELRASGARAVPVPCDLSIAREREALVARVEAEMGPVDVLVNNAAIFHGGAVHRRTLAEIEESAIVNLVAPMDLTRMVLRGMLERGRGHVVQVASLSGKVPMSFFALYSGTKHGLVGFTHALQGELHGTGVRVTAVCPGFVSDEGMWARRGGRAHWAVGMLPPERVARDVVRSLRRHDVERIVNRTPLRPAVALWSVAPNAARALYRWAGVDGFLRRAAENGERRDG